jgi:hypothetical protein
VLLKSDLDVQQTRLRLLHCTWPKKVLEEGFKLRSELTGSVSDAITIYLLQQLLKILYIFVPMILRAPRQSA